MVGTYVHAVSHAERRGFDGLLVCIFARSVLSILHACLKEFVDLVEVNDQVYGSQINHFGVWEDGDQLRVAKEDTPVVT